MNMFNWQAEEPEVVEKNPSLESRIEVGSVTSLRMTLETSNSGREAGRKAPPQKVSLEQAEPSASTATQDVPELVKTTSTDRHDNAAEELLKGLQKQLDEAEKKKTSTANASAMVPAKKAARAEASKKKPAEDEPADRSIRKHYHVIQGKLGQGASGMVRRAIHKSSGTVRAVKGVRIAKDADAVAFDKEVANLKQLQHPNIIGYVDTFSAKGNRFMVMELCEGGDLCDLLGNRKFVNETDTFIIMQDVLSAISYMHEKNIAHRDLKLDNCMLQTKRALRDNTVKVIDFGLSKECKEGEVMKSHVGTPWYVAPEVLQRRYGREIDFWSAGAMMYMLLSATPPFEGDTDQEIVQKVAKGKFSFTGPRWESIMPETKNLVGYFMEKDPEARLSATLALSHPFIKSARVRDSAVLFSKAKAGLYNSLENFKNKRPIAVA